MAALLVASCSNQVIDGAATTAKNNIATPSQGATAQSDQWGQIGAMGEGRPEFPTEWDRHRLFTEWDSQTRAFEGTLTYITSSRGPGERFLPTMNGCDSIN